MTLIWHTDMHGHIYHHSENKIYSFTDGSIFDDVVDVEEPIKHIQEEKVG